MNEHDDAYVNAMLMVNMQANTRSVTLWIISRVKCSPISVRLRINSLLRSQISTSAHHAEDVRASKFPGVLDKLLEPVPRPLRLLDRS